MNINDFNCPTKHPYNMCSGYANAYEKESLLVYILMQCIGAGSITAVIETKYHHDTMVKDGLLEQIGEDRKYRLTPKSIGLLYSFYGK